MENLLLAESIYTSTLKSGYQSNLMNTNLMNTEMHINDDIADEDCEVKITDVSDFLANLKGEIYNYADMSEINRRNNQSRIRPNVNRSQMNYSTNLLANSRLNGSRLTNHTGERSHISMLLGGGTLGRSVLTRGDKKSEIGK